MDENGEAVEYQGHEEDGHSEWIGPVPLPAAAENQPRVELLWRYYFTGEQEDEDSGQRSMLHIADIEIYTSVQAGNTAGIPGKFQLYQNFPNPFYPVTAIRYDLPEPQQVRMDLYSITGQHISTLTDRQYPAGRHMIELNASSLASGIYFYRFVSEEHIETRKLTVIK
ncbi:MAG: T9SS type A sorting domain-containing protein [Balneolaceae bacterium]